MFTLEAMLSARLNHPNIVQVFEFAEVEGERYLAMEYVHGINVGDLMKRLKKVPMPIGMAAHIVREVSLALAYAHALTDEDGRPLSLIHRDISPSNVMIGYDGSVKLVDFGVAKALTQSDERTRTGSLKGKVAYMSPEAVDGEVELDRRTDVFAAGVVLYELLTAKRLFRGHDDLKTIALVRACKVDPPSQARPEIPPDLDVIVARALARDRDQRYQSADELAASLTKVAHEHVWDAFRTAAFLKQNDIQPGSEPELRAITPVATPALARVTEAAENLNVTVVERKGGRSSTSLPVVTASRPRLTWALVGAGGALALAAGVMLGINIWTARHPAPGAEAPVPAVVTSPAPATVESSAPPLPAPVTLPPAPPLPASVAATAPVVGESALATAESATPPASLSPSTKQQRRKRRLPRPPRTAAAQVAPPAAIPARPEIDLKRGDVLNTF